MQRRQFTQQKTILGKIIINAGLKKFPVYDEDIEESQHNNIFKIAS